MRRRAIRWVRPFRSSGEVIANQTGHTCLHNHRMWMFDGDCCEQSHPWVYPCRIRRKGRKVEHLGVYLSGPFFLCWRGKGLSSGEGRFAGVDGRQRHLSSCEDRFAGGECAKAMSTPMRDASPEKRPFSPSSPAVLRPSHLRHSRTLNL